MGCPANKKSFLFLKWNGRHQWQMPHCFHTTIEDGMKKLWVVLVCVPCKSIKKMGLANESKAGPDDKASPMHDFKFEGE